jgi:MFS transporter, putative metabolite:H+ symporter
MVVIGGNAAGAYALTSWLAAALIPHYSWRIMWLIGLPTGLLLIVLNRWIPESPRYLIAAGQRAAAERIMARYGAGFLSADDDRARELNAPDTDLRNGFVRLFTAPFLGTSLAITIMAAGIGLVTFGFQLWIPTNLQHLGFTAVNTDYTVRNAALIGLPVTLAVAWLYGFWSTRKTITLLGVLTVVTLFWFMFAGDSLAHQHALLTGLLVVPLSGTGAVVAVLFAYASEVYPTRVRSLGTGHAAAMAKAGGVLIIGVVVAAATIPSMALTALIGAIPLGIGTAIFAWRCPETIHRPLDEIAYAEMSLAGDG